MQRFFTTEIGVLLEANTIYIVYKYEQFLKPVCPVRSKTWAGWSPELAGMLYMEFRAVRVGEGLALKCAAGAALIVLGVWDIARTRSGRSCARN